MSSFDQPDSPLVSIAWLKDHLGDPGTKIADATWLLQPEGRVPAKEFLERHIPGALFFDIDEIKDTASPLPHMLPSPEKFCSRMRKFGVGDGHQVVVYANASLMSAARVWWMFRAMGHENCVVLDGGFETWLAEGHPVESGERIFGSTHFRASVRHDLIASADDVLRFTGDESRPVIDARPAERFAGSVAEPRPGLRSGHIPGSINIPASSLVSIDGRLKPKADLAAIFAAAGVDASKRFVTSCGSGVSACVVALAAAQLGNWEVAIYDGSWAEWGARADLPISQTSL